MAVPFRVKAIHEYSSEHEDDLSFSLGQTITVTEIEDADWYNGEYVDNQGITREGIFPRNHVKFEPTAPPRPTRTRPKKESEAPSTVPTETLVASTSHAAGGEEHDDAQVEAHPGPVTEHRSSMPPETLASQSPPSQSVTTAPLTSFASIRPQQSDLCPAPAAPIAAASPQFPSDAGPASPDKPAVSSFKDRIAAFNKSNAPPILPGKPGVGRSDGSSFIKKPFVAPPPKRDAYVAPPRQTPVAQAPRPMEEAENRPTPLLPTEAVEKSDQRDETVSPNEPAPTSLKERIAQLQRQRMEDQRNSEAAAKKEKPKKPPKKRTDSAIGPAAAPEAEQISPSSDRKSMDNASTRTSTDDMRSARIPSLPVRRISRGPGIDQVLDGNDADVSGAGDATEGPSDSTGREESDGLQRSPTQRTSLSANFNVVKTVDEDLEASEEEDDEEAEQEVDPEVRRREELRARIQKTGGMGIPGLFHMSDISATAKPSSTKPAAEEDTATEVSEEPSPIARGAPAIPILSSMPGSSTYDAKQERKKSKSHGPASPTRSVQTAGPLPPAPASRPAPPPIPTDTRPLPPPPAPPVDIKSQTEGSESDIESSAEVRDAPTPVAGSVAPQPAMPPHTPVSTRRSPPLPSRPEESSPSPSKSATKRVSRPPPAAVPGQAPTVPTPQNRPPPPGPPTALSRQSTATSVGLAAMPISRPSQAGEEDEEELTEYEADIDTDNQNQEAAKELTSSHSRERDADNGGPSHANAHAPPPSQPPPIPLPGPPRWQNSSQRSGESGLRRSLDAPVSAPPPPPQTRESFSGNLESAKDTSKNQTVMSGALGASSSLRPERIEEGHPIGSTADTKAPASSISGRAAQRPSMEATRTSTSNRRSIDVLRPSMESGFIANDIDLAYQSGWWQRADQLPPALQGRKDIHYEYVESASTNQGRKTIVTRETFVLYQDYSQTILTARYDPHNVADVELSQRHEPPPRALRQDQMEDFHERFGLKILESAASKKDTVVGDGTPQGLILELLRPLDDALRPVGARSYGALVYSNMANASTQQFDVIRAGDILSIRNAKFQGKHRPMHAKYSMEVGKPDHVAVVGEWDGTKKKVRAWEQGRENKKVKLESFKLDDLRSGEVKIWRVVPRSWVGWHR